LMEYRKWAVASFCTMTGTITTYW